MAGINLRLAREVLYVYLGGGYGQKTLFWQADEYNYADDSKIGDIWASHEGFSYSGFEEEAGLLIFAGKLYFSAGMSTIPGKRYDAAFGLGLGF